MSRIKGSIGYWKGKELSNEMKKKISVAMTGKHQSEQAKEKLRLFFKGKPGHSQTIQTRAKIRAARMKQKLPTKDTSIELKVKDYLDRKGVNYIQQFNLGDRFHCDFYIPFLNLIVE